MLAQLAKHKLDNEYLQSINQLGMYHQEIGVQSQLEALNYQKAWHLQEPVQACSNLVTQVQTYKMNLALSHE